MIDVIVIALAHSLPWLGFLGFLMCLVKSIVEVLNG